jgi:CheY-like chemotaxis protein
MARVLVVEDDATGLEIRKLILEHAGHQVFAAANAEQAIMHCEAVAPDCALIDLRLPNPEDGLALLRDLRRIRPEMKTIVLCGYPADIEGRPEREWVDEIFCKPVHPEQLLRVVDNVPAVKLGSS